MKQSLEISLDERKSIQLEMLQEIHDFCVANNIKYSLAFGTLLGAIRHKGYIPWDDDVDIMMPLPDMLKFKELFTSDFVKYCDVDNEPYYEYPFSRLSYKPTYRKVGLIVKSYGVNIDLYPVVSIPSESVIQKQYFEKAQYLHDRKQLYWDWRTRVITRLPIKSIPGFHKAVKDLRDHLFDNSCQYGSTDAFYIIAIPIEKRTKVMYNFDLFSELIIVPFESKSFQITGFYKEFLSHMYGDYMQLPPDNERIPYHGGDYFWKK